MRVKVGDRIELNGNGRDIGRTYLKNYASGIVTSIYDYAFNVKFDNGRWYLVNNIEQFKIIPKKEKVEFT